MASSPSPTHNPDFDGPAPAGHQLAQSAEQQVPAPASRPQAVPAAAATPHADLPAEVPVVGPSLDITMLVPAPTVRWMPGDYAAAGIGGYNAEKLATSAIAPLVAAARGYETFDASTIDEAFSRYDLGRKNSKQGRRVIDALGRADLMVMPWFTPDEIYAADRFANVPLPTSIQYRPARPAKNDEGKELKYEFVVDHHSPLGLHPAIPSAWLDAVPRVLVAEGLLKGDAALSGMLIDAGVPIDELRLDNVEDPRAKMRELLERIPVEKRVLILTIAGVWNWRKNPEWRSLQLRGREVWVGIDGDISTNPQVHKAASELFDYIDTHHRATPKLLSPVVTASDAGDLAKIGIDDYLAEVGNWASLLAMLTDTLPPAPAGKGADTVGAVRINEAGTAMEKCEPIIDSTTGAVIGGRWTPVIALGGRVLSMVAEREPTHEEVATGRFGAGVTSDDATWDVEVEVSWENAAGDVERHVVHAPANILNYTPDQWDRKGARIPAPVLRNPEWPPAKTHGEAWLKAIKSNRHDETATRVRWAAMGWVPVEGGVPAFVIGDQVIGGDDTDAEVLPGITDVELAGAPRFGVGADDPRPFSDEAYQAEIRRDLSSVVEIYVQSGAWTDPRVAAVVMACGLRPALPLRAATTCYFCGPPRKGKSFSAGAVMGFWSRTPGDWTGGMLPGSAKDTITSTEHAVSKTPIWVVDDLAPAVSARQADNEQDALGTLIRNIHNGAAKRRSNADGSARRVKYPKALLVATAENEPQTQSVKDRIVSIYIGFGSLSEDRGPTNAIDALYMRDGAPARVSQALVKYIRHLALTSAYGWEDVYRQIKDARDECRANAADLIASSGSKVSDAKRAADMAGDLMVALMLTGRMATELGMDDEFVSLFSLRGMAGAIASLSGEGYHANNETSTGRRIITAASSVLRRGRAHIINGDDTSVPPGESDGGNFTSQLLGWTKDAQGVSRRSGEAIGVLIHKDGNPVVLLDPRAAFNVAAQHHPELVQPGQGQRSSWGSVWDENLVHPGFKRDTAGAAGGSTTVRVVVGKTSDGKPVRYSGVPVPLDVLLSGGLTHTEEEDDSDD